MAKSTHISPRRAAGHARRVFRSSDNRVAFVAIALGTGVVLIVAGAIAALVGAIALTPATYEEVRMAALWGAVGALNAAMLAALALPLLRQTLVSSNRMRLVEAGSPMHPLLKRLMIEAPGTYTHSVATANVAEAGAEAIGADVLLARVGAYYHDVGKIGSPCFFFENQHDGVNPHDSTAPALSAKIITAHVTDGLALADEYHLPEEVRQIIVEHHGSSLVRYFYHKASQDDAGLFEADFRYKGVPPRSREAALVMLADASEASVRALGTPTPDKVENIVRAVIDEKAEDDQLVDSGLTEADLEKVVEAYSRALVGMYHARCEYPDRATAVKGDAVADHRVEPSGA